MAQPVVGTEPAGVKKKPARANYWVKRVSVDRRLRSEAGGRMSSLPTRSKPERQREAIMVAIRDFTNRAGRSVVVALPDSPLATAAVERLRQRGWQVTLA